VEDKYSLSIIVSEKLRWVHGGKGQVAQQDRVKTIMTGPDAHRVSTVNKVPSNGCYHPTPMWKINIAYLQL
jgi:hypothetical protein